MEKKVIQNRNRIVYLMNNCAKISFLRAETSETPLPRMCKQLVGKLANNDNCGSIVEELMKHYTQYNDLLTILKDKTKTISKEFIDESVTLIDQALAIYKQKQSAAAAHMNSAEYFEALQTKEKSETEELKRIQKRLEDEGKTKSKEYKDIVLEINTRQAKLREIEEKLEEKRKEKDAVKELENKIQPLVTNLETTEKGLIDEILRFKVLFFTYLVATITIFIFLLGWETFLICRYYDKLPCTDWRLYIAFYLPIPLAAGLLGTFIYQMNSVQRKSVLLNAKMQSIGYKDSLLKTSAMLYSNQQKNEEHVATLIDSIMKEKTESLEDLASDKGILPSIPIDKIIELIKAYQGK